MPRRRTKDLTAQTRRSGRIQNVLTPSPGPPPAVHSLYRTNREGCTSFSTCASPQVLGQSPHASTCCVFGLPSLCLRIKEGHKLAAYGLLACNRKRCSLSCYDVVLNWFRAPRGGGRMCPAAVQSLREGLGVLVVGWLMHWLISCIGSADCGQMHSPRNNHSTSATNILVFMHTSPRFRALYRPAA
jgi:hypothetical protein